MIAQRAYDPWGGHDLSARPLSIAGIEFSPMPAGSFLDDAGRPSRSAAPGRDGHVSQVHLLPDHARPAGAQATPDSGALGVAAPAGSISVTFGPDAGVILTLAAAALRTSLDEAAARAVCFYAEHGLGIPLLASRAEGAPAGRDVGRDARSGLRAAPDARADLTDLPDFDRTAIGRPRGGAPP